MKIIVYHDADGRVLSTENLDAGVLEGLRYGMSEEAAAARYSRARKVLGTDEVASFLVAAKQAGEAETLLKWAKAKYPDALAVVIEHTAMPPGDFDGLVVKGGAVIAREAAAA